MTDDPARIAQRKRDHLRIVLDEPVASGLTTGLERCRLVHCALPDLDLADVETGTEFLGHRLRELGHPDRGEFAGGSGSGAEHAPHRQRRAPHRH